MILPNTCRLFIRASPSATLASCPSVSMIGTITQPVDGPAALAQVDDEVRACTRCALSARRTLAVPGEGNLRSDVLLVGEGPGAREDAWRASACW